MMLYRRSRAILPELSHLQFHVLTGLLERERSGRELRAWIAKEGQRKSLAAFYQLMSRMEDAKLVSGWYENKTVDGQGVKERRYRILNGGIRAWESTRKYYVRASRTRRELAQWKRTEGPEMDNRTRRTWEEALHEAAEVVPTSRNRPMEMVIFRIFRECLDKRLGSQRVVLPFPFGALFIMFAGSVPGPDYRGEFPI